MRNERELPTLRLNKPFTFNSGPIGLKCPHCGIVEVNSDELPEKCQHIVFVYDFTNYEYLNISGSFLKFLRRYLSNNDRLERLDDIDKESIDEFLSDGDTPSPEVLRDCVRGLNLFEAYDVDGVGGFIWGHVSERLIKEINAKSTMK